jgi:predicted transcriptional regulator of viral defense system
MKWEQFYKEVNDRPVIESQYLHLLYGNKKEVQLQLSRWTKQGKIHQLKRGYYILYKEYRKMEIFEPYIAAILKAPSYISLEKALEMHRLIPDVVFTFTSVTTKRRPAEFINPAGRFKYVCLKKDYFWGYRVIQQQHSKGYLAEPEKAIIDLFYFLKKSVEEEFIHSLRLQNTELLSAEKLTAYAKKMAVPFVMEAVDLLVKILFNGQHRGG